MSSSRLSNASKIRQIQQERYDHLQWSTNEMLLRNRPKHVQDFFKGRQVPFRLLTQVKFRRSLFGPFLDAFNSAQIQDMFLNETKLAIFNYDMKSFTANELKHLEEDNNFVEDIYRLLVEAVAEKDVIDCNFLYERIYALRFIDTPLTFIDEDMRRFKNLRILILCGNWLTDIGGMYLPRCLEYIELFANQIEYISNFVSKIPRNLLHIGLKRNWLTNDSQLHLFGKPKKFNYLRSLDLSENDIYEMEMALEGLKLLENLQSLQLQGNPCSVTNTYKDEVLRYLPNLAYLDNTEIMEEDRELNPHDIKVDAAITFTCHRIIGLPPPKKEKNVEHQFYFEVGMPLLEEVILPPEVDISKDFSVESQAKKKKEGQDRGDSEKRSTAKRGSKVKRGGAKTELSFYDAPDETSLDAKSGVINTAFKTERFEWAKIIQLPEEAIVIHSPDRNFTDIRDTFRTRVNVKLIYLKIEPPQAPSKKGKGKSEKSEKKDKTKAKSSKSTETSTTNETTEEEEPKETILKKVTVADFWCELHSINWSDKTIDYYWGQHTDCGNSSSEVEGSLRALNYGDGSSPNPKKRAKNGDKTDVDDATKQLTMPKILTVQVGFGLVRDFPQMI